MQDTDLVDFQFFLVKYGFGSEIVQQLTSNYKSGQSRFSSRNQRLAED